MKKQPRVSWNENSIIKEPSRNIQDETLIFQHSLDLDDPNLKDKNEKLKELGLIIKQELTTM